MYRLSSEPVLIHVGESKAKFYIHERLLRANSNFFDTALKKEWRQGRDRSVAVPDTEIETFKIYIKWLYTGRIFIIKEGDARCVNGTYQRDEWARWQECYCLGDFLQDHDFKDACIDALIEVMCNTNTKPISLATLVYRKSTKLSKHRKVAVDTFIRCRTRSTWSKESTAHPEFLLDVITAMSTEIETGVKLQQPKDYFSPGDTCKYHDHGPEKPCYKKKPAFNF